MAPKRTAMESDDLELGEAAVEVVTLPLEIGADLISATADLFISAVEAPFGVADEVLKDAGKWLE